MTTGNDEALPQPGADPAITDPAQTNNQPAEPAIADPDITELSEAQAAAQAEEAAGQGAAQPGAAAGTPTTPLAAAATPGQPQTPQQPAAGEAIMIPKPRLDEQTERTRKAEQDAAYWRGVAEARAQGAPGQPAQQQQQQPALTAEQRIAELDTQLIAVAKKFDDGEIGMADFVKSQREIEGKIVGIRQEAAPRHQAAPAPAAGHDPLYLETLTAQLEKDHAWVPIFDQVATDAEWEFLKGRALENLAARHVDPKAGDLGRYELRKEIAQLADQLGPALIGERAKAKGFTLPGQQSSQQQQQQQPQLSPAAAARKAGLEKAAGAPPNVANMNGGSVDVGGIPSDATVEGMSDEEISALPIATRNKLLGITA